MKARRAISDFKSASLFAPRGGDESLRRKPWTLLVTETLATIEGVRAAGVALRRG